MRIEIEAEEREQIENETRKREDVKLGSRRRRSKKRGSRKRGRLARPRKEPNRSYVNGCDRKYGRESCGKKKNNERTNFNSTRERCVGVLRSNSILMC